MDHLPIHGVAEHHELLFPGEGTRTQEVHYLEFFLKFCYLFICSVYLALGSST